MKKPVKQPPRPLAAQTARKMEFKRLKAQRISSFTEPGKKIYSP
jgi:hypothetical protein